VRVELSVTFPRIINILRPDFTPSMCNVSYYSRANRPSPGIQAVVIRKSSAHCNAVLCCSLGLRLFMGVNHLFYLGVLELHLFAVWFCWLWLS
jgi:hypothetical protein